MTYVKKNKGKGAGLLTYTEQASPVLKIFDEDWISPNFYPNTPSAIPCQVTNETAADGKYSLKCQIFNRPTYVWFANYLTQNTPDRVADQYTHYRLKIKSAKGYGNVHIGLYTDGHGDETADLYNPNYYVDALPINDNSWKTIYVPIADLGLNGGTYNSTTIVNMGYRPMIFYLDSMSLVKATTANKDFTAFPVTPDVSFERSSGYEGLTLGPDGYSVNTNPIPHTTGDSSALVVFLLSVLICILL